jgi:hypothetical protein
VSSKLQRLRIVMPISPTLTPQDVENIIVSASNLAANLHQIPANDVELEIQIAPPLRASALNLALSKPVPK